MILDLALNQKVHLIQSFALKIYDLPSDFIDTNDDSWHVEDQEHKNKNATDPS